MTRNEFLENVCDWWRLKDFCSDTGCDICVDIYDNEDRDSEIDYYIGEYLHDSTWQELRDLLADIPNGYDFYRENSALDWDGLDDSDFDDYKYEVLQYADEHDIFDEEDEDDFEDDVVEDDTEPEPEPEEDEETVEDEAFSVDDLIDMCGVTFVAIQQDNLRRIQKERAEFAQFVDMNILKVLS